MFLNCHTAFSFKYGTLSVQRLYDEAKRCGVRKLILTEINNTTSYIELLRICEERNNSYDGYALTIALGVEFRQDNTLLYIAVAKNNSGFENINRFLSQANRDKQKFSTRMPALADVFVIYPSGKVSVEQLRDDEYIGIQRHQLNGYRFSNDRKTHPHKFVYHHPVTFENKIDFNIHRLLRAIDANMLLSKLPIHHQADASEIMQHEAAVINALTDFPELIKNTEFILANSTIAFQLRTDKNKKHISGSNASDLEVLNNEAWRGFERKYDATDPVLLERFHRELEIIKGKDFGAYFLIAYDLIQFANAQGFNYVGRGSGANSVIAYCLGITNVDPIELDLYFERFLNPERSSPPDFDIDFAWDNRDAIYEYIFTKYGYEHVCLLGTHVTYQRRSIVRELGKVFGLPKDEIDSLVDDPARHGKRDHIAELIIRYAERMIELPANISIHAGGVLITEKPIYAYTATELPPKGYPVSHFEMHNAEDMGIFKFDILSQRGLGHLKEAVLHVQRNKGIAVDIHRFHDFKHDEKIKNLLRTSRTIGCFYVESPGMRMLLEKLQCEDYLTLVAASSIIRPGVASSGMMRTFIERYHVVKNGGTYASVHPKMDELMSETYGVMVYQEDVIKVAHHFAKLTLAEADVLRRGMSGKFRSRIEFERVRDRFFENCRREEYDEAVINRVWFEIESFAGYSFAKGHSASYAVESYQSLYLKAHYPLEFMVGVINNFGGFYKTEFYFHEARMSGADIKAPCVNNSTYLTTIYDQTIYIGFIHLKSLETKVGQRMEAEREKNGDYISLDNFLRRVPIALEQVRILIRVGAFRFTQKSKQRLLWEALLYFGNAKSRPHTTVDLFDTEPKHYPLPVLEQSVVEDAFDEIELIGFPLCDPFTLVDTSTFGDAHAKDLSQKLNKQITILGYLVTTKPTRTKDGKPMHFGTFYDQEGNVFDTVHFPNVALRYPFRGRGFYFIHGKVVADFNIAIIEVNKMEKIPFLNKKELPPEADTAYAGGQRS